MEEAIYKALRKEEKSGTVENCLHYREKILTMTIPKEFAVGT